MKLTIHRYDDKCGALPSIDVSTDDLPLPLEEEASFSIWIDSPNGIPYHGGSYCVSSKEPGFEYSHPFGVEVALGELSISGSRKTYVVTVVALECPCAGGRP